MAKRAKAKNKKKKRKGLAWSGLWARVRRIFWRSCLAIFAALLLWIAAYGIFAPPTTPYIWSEKNRLGSVEKAWVEFEDIAPVMVRSVVAAEDANFCNHWGMDMTALRAAIAEGGERGASTISQQTVKNIFLWHGRSYVRKVLEGVMTPLLELVWTKRRILEVYLNMIEYDEGVFGVEAASLHYFGVPAVKLSNAQAAALAAVLPNPKNRSASRPSARLKKRARMIADGAETIRKDGRASCFED